MSRGRPRAGIQRQALGPENRLLLFPSKVSVSLFGPRSTDVQQSYGNLQLNLLLSAFSSL